jgi:hypothetical protein
MLTFVGYNIVYTGHAGQFAIPRLAYRVTEYRPRPILATAAGPGDHRRPALNALGQALGAACRHPRSRNQPITWLACDIICCIADGVQASSRAARAASRSAYPAGILPRARFPH